MWISRASDLVVPAPARAAPSHVMCHGQCSRGPVPLGVPKASLPTAVPPPSSLQVVVLDKLDYCATLRNLDSVRDCPNFKFVKGDIQSTDLLVHLLETEDIDTIMHFAAQTHVDNSFGNSLAFTMNNTCVWERACCWLGDMRCSCWGGGCHATR